MKTIVLPNKVSNIRFKIQVFGLKFGWFKTIRKNSGLLFGIRGLKTKIPIRSGSGFVSYDPDRDWHHDPFLKKIPSRFEDTILSRRVRDFGIGISRPNTRSDCKIRGYAVYLSPSVVSPLTSSHFRLIETELLKILSGFRSRNEVSFLCTSIFTI